MTTTLYKRLFEVRVLHGYYLDGHHFTQSPKRPKFFQAYDKPEREQTLVERAYDIWNDLEITPLPATEKLMRGWKMRWKTTPFGFFAGLEVRRTGNLFFPAADLPDGMVWTFLLRVRNPAFYNFTNYALRPTLPGRYFFTNRREPVAKAQPSLALPPLPLAANPRSWEMGELAQLPDNTIGRAPQRITNAVDFEVLAEHYDWASAADCRALPKRFRYRFDPAAAVVKAEFTLTDRPNSAVVKTIVQEFPAAAPPAGLALDFATLPLLPGQTVPLPLPDGFYDLTVRINDLPFEQRPVVLRADLPADNDTWGLVEIVLDRSQTDALRLLEADGSLRLEEADNHPGSWVLKKPFEIRLMRRDTWWHYKIESPDHSQLPPHAATRGDFTYNKPRQTLESTTPLPLLRTRAPASLGDGNPLLPNPDRPDLQFDPATGRYISQLFLQTIKIT